MESNNIPVPSSGDVLTITFFNKVYTFRGKIFIIMNLTNDHQL